MPTAEKEAAIEQLQQTMDNAAAIFLANLRGERLPLTAAQRAELDELRPRVLPADGGGDPWSAHFAVFASDHQPTWRRRPWYLAIDRSHAPSQRRDGAYLGSWDPAGPSGRLLGRTGTTALRSIDLMDGFRDCFWRDGEE